MIVFDLIKNLHIDDNISYYNEGKGKKDITMVFICSSEFECEIQKLLSSVSPFPKGLKDSE